MLVYRYQIFTYRNSALNRHMYNGRSNIWIIGLNLIVDAHVKLVGVERPCPT